MTCSRSEYRETKQIFILELTPSEIETVVFSLMLRMAAAKDEQRNLQRNSLDPDDEVKAWRLNHEADLLLKVAYSLEAQELKERVTCCREVFTEPALKETCS
jgi:hypothetical protein